MRFQLGHSGNPAGRPPGSLNKKTLALDAVFADRAEEILNDVLDSAKKGDRDARRLCMERILPRKRDSAIAIELPVIKTPEDAEKALAVVHAELAAGHLTIREATALVALVDRMVRVAERIWAFRRARRHGAKWDSITLDDVETPAEDGQAARTEAAEAAETDEKPGAPLYSPVNSRSAAGEGAGNAARGEGEPSGSAVPRKGTSPPLPRAA